MALSPVAATLKERAIHAADSVLGEHEGGPQGPLYVRIWLAATWLDGYKTGQMEHDRYVDEARHYLSALASGVGHIGR